MHWNILISRTHIGQVFVSVSVCSIIRSVHSVTKKETRAFWKSLSYPNENKNEESLEKCWSINWFDRENGDDEHLSPMKTQVLASLSKIFQTYPSLDRKPVRWPPERRRKHLRSDFDKFVDNIDENSRRHPCDRVQESHNRKSSSSSCRWAIRANYCA